MGEKLDFYSLKELIIFSDKAKSRRSILLRVSTQVKSCRQDRALKTSVLLLMLLLSVYAPRALRHDVSRRRQNPRVWTTAVQLCGLSAYRARVWVCCSFSWASTVGDALREQTAGGDSEVWVSSLVLSLRLISLAYACVVTMVTLRGRGDADRRNGPSTSTGTPARSEIKTRRRKNALRIQESERSDVSVSVFGV